MVKRSTRTKAVIELEVRPRAAQSAAVPFESLVVALEGWFDKDLADLPADKRRRVERDFPYPDYWDGNDAAWRRHESERWDYRNNPALEETRTADWDGTTVGWNYWQKVSSLTAQEFCILRHVCDPRKFEKKQSDTPGGEGKTLGERVSDDVRIVERSLGPGTMKPVQQWVLWAHAQGWLVPSYLQRASVAQSAPGSEGELSQADASPDDGKPNLRKGRNSRGAVKAWVASEARNNVKTGDTVCAIAERVQSTAERFGYQSERGPLTVSSIVRMIPAGLTGGRAKNTGRTKK